MAAASYVIGPWASEALGATIAKTARANKSAVEGHITYGHHGVKGVTVQVYKLVSRKHGSRKYVFRKLVAKAMSNEAGKFRANVKPGRYLVVLSDHSKARKVLRVKVAPHKAIFIVGKVTKSSGLFGIVPVIFNY